MSIAVDDGRDSAGPGDELTYTVIATNLGSTPIEQLWISQRVPAGLAFGSADKGGELQGDAVIWTADVAASEVFTAQAVLTVG